MNLLGSRWLAVAALCLLLGLVSCASYIRSRQLSESDRQDVEHKWSLLRHGMTKSEVRRILGISSSTTHEGNWEAWYYECFGARSGVVYFIGQPAEVHSFRAPKFY